MKTLKYLALATIALAFIACGSDEDDEVTPAKTYDFTGVYTGEVTYSTARTAAGDPLVVTINGKNGNSYKMLVNDEAVADIVAAANNFTGTALPGQSFTGLKGSLSGDQLSFSAKDGDTTFSFVGSRPSSGGGNNGGGKITVDGKTYDLILMTCEDGETGGNSRHDIFGAYNINANGATDPANISFSFKSKPSAGTYSIVKDDLQDLASDQVATTLQVGLSSQKIYESHSGNINVTMVNGNPSINISGIVYDWDQINETKTTPPSISGTVTCQ